MVVEDVVLVVVFVVVVGRGDEGKEDLVLVKVIVGVGSSGGACQNLGDELAKMPHLAHTMSLFCPIVLTPLVLAPS